MRRTRRARTPGAPGSQLTQMLQADVLEGPADPSMLLNSLAVNVKVCKELLEQAQASLHCVEARRGRSQRTRSVPGPSHSAAGRAVVPPSACYTLFHLLPRDSEWAKNLEKQVRTHTYELLPKEQLAAALRFLTEGPTEECTLYQTAEGTTQGPSLHHSAEYQSAEGPTEGPTLYQSVLDLSPSENTQEQRLRGGAQMQDLSDSRCPSESSEEGPPSSLQPSMGLLHIEVGDLSSITHSPPHHQKILNLLFKRHLAPCNSTPRSTGVQLISDTCHLVSSPSALQSYCTAVDESANLSPNSYPAVKAATWGQHQGEGELKAGVKRAQEELLFESEGTAEGEAQGTAQGESQGTAQGESQGTAEGEAQGTAQGEAQGTVQGKAQGTAARESEGTAEGKSDGTDEGQSERTAAGEAQEASHHQLYMSNMDIRSHLTLDNEPDSADKESALVNKVVSRTESREGQESEESLPGTPPSDQSEDRCSPHEHGEPQWASLLTESYRAHSTLDDILQAHTQD